MSSKRSMAREEKNEVQKTQQVWEELQRMIPESGNTHIDFGSLRRDWGKYVIFLQKRGFIFINFRLEIRINEEKRGERFV